MQDLLDAVLGFAHRHIAVVGDVMLDTTVHGEVNRISPEAPIPILRAQREQQSPGGAANVARNVARLGGTAVLVGVIGADDAGARLAEALGAVGHLEARLVQDRTRATTLKTRFVAHGQQLLRVDHETTQPVAGDVEAQLLVAIEAALEQASGIVFSDYAKGALSAQVMQRGILIARERGAFSIVDPKERDLSRYAGATVITPNAIEAAAATGIDCSEDDGARRAGEAIIALGNFKHVIITRSARGMTVVSTTGEGRVLHVPAHVREVHDVSGAGDTVVAALALGLATGLPIGPAARLANLAAGIVVGKAGTAAVEASELVGAVQRAQSAPGEGKIVGRDTAAAFAQAWRSEGRRVVFTNGCFDILHPGHVRLLQSAKEKGDVLIVALNTDRSVRRLKGAGRPVQDETSRAVVIASLAAVDLVMLFDEDTPIEAIAAIRPDVLVKGADYALDQVVGREFVEANGGTVELVAIEPGYSTTGTIERALAGKDRQS